MCCDFPSTVAEAEGTLICKLCLEAAIRHPILIHPFLKLPVTQLRSCLLNTLNSFNT